MERRSSKREHHGQHYEPTGHRKSKYQRPSETSMLAIGDPKRQRSHYSPVKGSLAPALSGDDDYVRRWLAQTNEDVESDLDRARTQEGKPEHRDAKSKPQLDLRSFRHAIDDSENAPSKRQFKRKRHHRSSSDSSLLKPVMKPESKWRKDDPKLHTGRREGPVSHQPKKRKALSSDSVSLAEPNQHQETFEKRSRHKTREDLYEPERKKHKSDKADRERKSKKKRGKKASKKASEYLLKNFSSKSVSQDRLTIRPSHGPGLFKNGRASSPARRRGVPDLAFSEMEFLQRPPLLPDIKTTSKSRDKDRRRAFREQDEISTFFRPKAPLEETSPNVRGERSSTYLSDEQPMKTKHGAVDQTQKNLHHSTDLPERLLLGFSQSGPSSDRFSGSRGRTPLMQHIRTIPDTTSRLSENTTAGMTWSETQIVPRATATLRQQSHDYQDHPSPTPESIQKSIENTGILKDTGISDAPDLSTSQAKPAPENNYHKQALRDILDGVENSNRTTKSATSQSTLASGISNPSPKGLQSGSIVQTPQLQHNIKADKERAIGQSTRNSSEERAIRREGLATTKRSQVAVELYDPNLGLLTQQDSGGSEKAPAAPSIDVSTLGESKSAPINREQIAKDARVKRPTTSLLLARVSREPIAVGENNLTVPARWSFPEENATKNDRVNAAPTKEALRLMPAEVPESARTGGQLARSERESQVRQPEYDNKNFYSNSKDRHTRLFSYSSIPVHFDRSPRRGPIDDPASSMDRSEATWLRSLRTEMTPHPRLSIQGPSCDSFVPPQHPSRVFPVVESQPLYFNQIQCQFRSEETTHGNDYEPNQQLEEHSGLSQSEAISYLEDNGFNILKAHDCAEYRQNEYEEEVEYPAEDVAYDPQNVDVAEHCEIWNGVEHGMSNDYELANISYDRQVFAEVYEIEGHGDDYKQQTAEEEVPMQGFWRPIRLY